MGNFPEIKSILSYLILSYLILSYLLATFLALTTVHDGPEPHECSRIGMCHNGLQSDHIEYLDLLHS